MLWVQNGCTYGTTIGCCSDGGGRGSSGGGIDCAISLGAIVVIGWVTMANSILRNNGEMGGMGGVRGIRRIRGIGGMGGIGGTGGT